MDFDIIEQLSSEEINDLYDDLTNNKIAEGVFWYTTGITLPAGTHIYPDDHGGFKCILNVDKRLLYIQAGTVKMHPMCYSGTRNGSDPEAKENVFSVIFSGHTYVLPGAGLDKMDTNAFSINVTQNSCTPVFCPTDEEGNCLTRWSANIYLYQWIVYTGSADNVVLHRVTVTNDCTRRNTSVGCQCAVDSDEMNFLSDYLTPISSWTYSEGETMFYTYFWAWNRALEDKYGG